MEWLIGAVYLILFVLCVYLIYANFIANKKIQQIDKERLMIGMSYDELSAKYQEALHELNVKEMEQSDAFVKFISDSRESAYDFIELVQLEFAEFDKVFGPLIEKNKSLKQVSLEYRALKDTILPKENKIPNN